MSLNGKIVVLSGASEGLGSATARSLAAHGATLWLLARTEANLAKVAEDIRSSGGQAFYHVCDVTSATHVNDCVRSILESSDRIDILINNAGIWVEGETVSAPPETVERVFQVNVVGSVYLTQAVLPTMKEQKSGHIVNVVSLAGIEPSPDWGIYVATKYGLRGFSESLQLELQGTGIKVSALYPGGIDTNLYVNAGYPDKVHQPWMMSKEEVADVILYVLTRPSDILVDQVVIRKFM